MKTEKMKLIPIGSSEVLRVEGLEDPERFTLIKVTDTSIILKGNFRRELKPFEQSYRLEQITTIRRIDGGHTALRIAFGVLGGAAVIGLVSTAISDRDPALVRIIVVGATVTSIPFIMPRRDWKLGHQKYQLVIR